MSSFIWKKTINQIEWYCVSFYHILGPWSILHYLGSHFGWDKHGRKQEIDYQEAWSQEEYDAGCGWEGGQESGGGGHGQWDVFWGRSIALVRKITFIIRT